MGARAWPAVPSMVWFSAGAGLCVGAILARGAACRAAMALCVAALGAGWFALREYEPRADDLAVLLIGEDRALIAVEGVVVDEPRDAGRAGAALARFSFSQPRTRLDLDADTLVTP